MIAQAKNAPLSLGEAETCLFNFKENKSVGRSIDLFALKPSKDGTVLYTNEVLHNLRQQFLFDKSSFGMTVLPIKAHKNMTRDHTSQSQKSDNLFSNFGDNRKDVFEKAIL